MVPEQAIQNAKSAITFIIGLFNKEGRNNDDELSLVATKISNLLITTSKLILDHLQLFLFVPEINKILGGYLS